MPDAIRARNERDGGCDESTININILGGEEIVR